MWGNSTDNNDSVKGNNDGYSSFGGSSSFGNGGSKGFSDSFGQSLSEVDWTKEKLTPFQKVFYIQSGSKKNQGEVENFYRLNNVSAKSPHGEVPDPLFSWQSANLPTFLMNEITNAKFDKPSPIQSLALPVVLSGHDLIGIAETGSGKTLSFLLPSIVHINAQQPIKSGDGPIALVLAPTRELAMQIEKESVKFGKSSKLKCACVYGGADKQPQKNLLSSGVDIVIATPGRLIDFLESQATNMSRVTYLVLDEADRMLDMGFEVQIRKILNQVRPDRQTLMFSATWPKAVQKLAYDYCKNTPVHVQIGKHELSINERIKQIVYVTVSSNKTKLLIEQLDQLTQKDKVLIFAQTKRGCESMRSTLNAEGFNCLAIHGDKSQRERDNVMSRFKSGEVKILIATDVASRGLDVRDISHVINYDFPKLLEDYVHRIGRTGRAGAYGFAVSFVTSEDDRKIARDYVQMLQDANQEIPSDLLELANIHSNLRSQYKLASQSYFDIKNFQVSNTENEQYSSNNRSNQKCGDRERSRSHNKSDKNKNRYNNNPEKGNNNQNNNFNNQNMSSWGNY